MLTRFKKIALAISIVIILNLFVNYAIYTFYKPPKYEDFCPTPQAYYKTEKSCLDAGGKWFYTYGKEVPKPAPLTDEELGYCDADFYCRQTYEDAQSFYNRNVFIILIVVGLISIVIGFVLKVDTVANGFLFGGILSLIIGTIRYWSAMQDYLRVIILGIVLAFLIWLGYKKIRK